jgi:ribose transport system permease protein
MSFASPYFLTADNLLSMVKSFSVEAIVVIVMTILLISGGIDLSVGSVTALAMVIAGSLFLAGLDPWTASLIAIIAYDYFYDIFVRLITNVELYKFFKLFTIISRNNNRTW